jgi:hypothetical protein
LISSFQPSKALILLVASCLVWVLGISTALVFFFGSDAKLGWILAGSLVFSAMVWLLVMAREIRQAIDLSEYHIAGDSLIEQCRAIPIPVTQPQAISDGAGSSVFAADPMKSPPARIRTPRRRSIALPRKPAAGR